MNSPQLLSRLEWVLAQSSRWQPPGGVRLTRVPRLVEPLLGGLGNHSWLVDTSAGLAVVRLNTGVDAAFAVDRQRELMIHRAVAELGIAPRVWWADLEHGVLVRGFCPGRVWTSADFGDTASRRRLLAVLARIQQLALPLTRFDYWGHIRHYLTQLDTLAVAVPVDLAVTLAEEGEAIRNFQSAPWRPVLVHQDLNPANIVDTGSELALIDWEYAALGHPAMDLHQLETAADEGVAMPPALPEVINALWLLLSQALAKSTPR